jgi:hypothetical protein
MKKKFLVGGALVLVVGLVVVGLTYWPPQEAGKATGMIGKGSLQDIQLQKELWGALSTYEKSFLAAYSDQLAEQPDDPLELVAAFNELAYGVTGPGGLWRKTVPEKFFGCNADQETPACQSLKQSEAQFQRWDKLQQAANEVEQPRDALKFLKAHRAEIDEYLKTMVPVSDSMTSVEATPFFTANIAPNL